MNRQEKMFPTWSLRSLLLCGFVGSISHACIAAEAPLDVTLLLDGKKTVRSGCYGVNCETVGHPNWIDTDDFIRQFKDAGTPFFRYPGGTPANFYNPLTGLCDQPKGADRDYTLKNRKALQLTGGKGQKPDEFATFVKRTEARSAVVLNMATLSVEQNRKWLAELKREGIDIPAFELGNELYFGTYKWAFATPADYLKCARETTKMLRDLYPKAKVGILVPSQIYTDETFLDSDAPVGLQRQQKWLDMLKGETFFDAVVIHLYSTVGMDGKTRKADFLPFTEAYRHANAHINEGLEPALGTLQRLFPGKAIWITEYGLGGFAGEVRGYGLRHSHLGALVSDLMLLRFTAHPSVEIASWHSYNQLFSEDSKGGFQPRVSYQHFRLFAEPLRECGFHAPLEIRGQGLRKGTARHPSSYADVEGGAFFDGKKGYVLLINKHEIPYRLRTLNALWHGAEKKLVLVGGSQIAPRRDLPLEEALQDERKVALDEIAKGAPNTVVLPPYSFKRLAFEWREGAPEAMHPKKAAEGKGKLGS